MFENISIWTALADPKRRQIISLLAEKPRTTTNLTEFFDVTRFAIMKHLNVLEEANLIEVQREGRKRWNILNEDLAQFLRTKLANENESYQLTDILDLFPEQKPVTRWGSVLTEPFYVEQKISLQVPQSQVFSTFTECIDSWWSLRVATDSQILLEPFVNGRFYEAFNNIGQGALYGTITYIKQDEELRLAGTTELTEHVAHTFLPNNFIHIILESKNNTTQLTLRHYIIGLVDETTRDVCNQHWHRLLYQHFKAYVEKVIPYQHNP
jgi:DNA-binding transcriptional ArsR family regulator